MRLHAGRRGLYHGSYPTGKRVLEVFGCHRCQWQATAWLLVCQTPSRTKANDSVQPGLQKKQGPVIPASFQTWKKTTLSIRKIRKHVAVHQKVSPQRVSTQVAASLEALQAAIQGAVGSFHVSRSETTLVHCRWAIILKTGLVGCFHIFCPVFSYCQWEGKSSPYYFMLSGSRSAEQ